MIVRKKSCKRYRPFKVEKDLQHLMVEAAGNYGPHLKVLGYHETRVPLLKKELEHTKETILKGHEVEQANYGCSIISDA